MSTAIALTRPLDEIRRISQRARSRALALWQAHPRGMMGLGLFGLVGVSALASTLVTPSAPAPQSVSPPAPPPLIMKQVAPEEAVKLNAEIPVTAGPNPIAAPFRLTGTANARAQ